MRAHIGSGSVYLREWINVDLPNPGVFLAKERPDLVERYATLETDYYGRHQDKTVDALRPGPLNQETVCDTYGSFSFLPFRPESLEAIMAIQVFEHLDRSEARHAIDNCYRALKSGGSLVLDVPDPDLTLKLYRESGDDFYIRHLFGPRRNVQGFHSHYNRTVLRSLVEETRFDYVEELANIHHYPAFSLKWRKR